MPPLLKRGMSPGVLNTLNGVPASSKKLRTAVSASSTPMTRCPKVRSHAMSKDLPHKGTNTGQSFFKPSAGQCFANQGLTSD